MRILICPDSFKECLPSKQVAEHMATGIRRIVSAADIKIIPLADGGEGTVVSLVDATEGRLVKVKASDPLMRETASFFGVLGDGKTAVIEMAAASGLELLKAPDRNPWITSTFGTGELIKLALDEGCRKIILGVGGSATNDGGMGAAKALGIKFLDKNGEELLPGGGSLGSLHSIDTTGLDKRIPQCSILLACDVTNPLTGKNGASVIFGPQKGGDAAMIEKLDANLHFFADKIKQELGKDIERVTGSGAAGGLSAGLMAFANAEIKPGFELIKGITDFEKWIVWADLVITGEGRIDVQTQYGKTPFGVATIARKYDKPVVAVAGFLGEGYEVLYKHGFQCIVPITDRPMSLTDAIGNAGSLLENTAERIFRLMGLGYALRKSLHPGEISDEDHA